MGFTKQENACDWPAIPEMRLFVRSMICSWGSCVDQLAGRGPFKLQSCAESTLRRAMLGAEPHACGKDPVRFQLPSVIRNCRAGSMGPEDQSGSVPCHEQMLSHWNVEHHIFERTQAKLRRAGAFSSFQQDPVEYRLI